MANNVIIILVIWCCAFECVYPTINLISNLKNDVHKVRCKFHEFGSKLIHHELKHGDPCAAEEPTPEHSTEGITVNLLEQQGRYQQSTEPPKTTEGNERYLNGHSYGSRDANPEQFAPFTNPESNRQIYGPSEPNINHYGPNDNHYSPPSSQYGPNGHGQQYYNYPEPNKRFDHWNPNHFRQTMDHRHHHHYPGQYSGISFDVNVKPFGPFPGIGKSNGAFEQRPGFLPPRPADAFEQGTNSLFVPFGQLSGDGSYIAAEGNGPIQALGYKPIPSDGNFGEVSNYGLNGATERPAGIVPNGHQSGNGNYGVDNQLPTLNNLESGSDKPNAAQAAEFEPNQINMNLKHESERGNGGIIEETIIQRPEQIGQNPVGALTPDFGTIDQNLGINNGNYKSFVGSLEPIQQGLDNFRHDVANGNLFQAIPSNGNSGSAAVIGQNVAPSNKGEINPVDTDAYGHSGVINQELNPKNQGLNNGPYKPFLMFNLGNLGPALIQQNSFRPNNEHTGTFSNPNAIGYNANFDLAQSNGGYGVIGQLPQPNNVNFGSADAVDQEVKHLEQEYGLGYNEGISSQAGEVMAPTVENINPISSNINANKSGLFPGSDLDPFQQGNEPTLNETETSTNGTNVVESIEQLSGTIDLNLIFPVENNENGTIEMNMEINGSANGTDNILENTTIPSSTISSSSYGTYNNNNGSDGANEYTSSPITSSSTTPTYPDEQGIDIRLGAIERTTKKVYATVPPGGGKNLFQANCNNGEVMTSSGCMEKI